MTFNIGNRRYTGSKAALADWILTLISENCDGESFADIFAGTGIIACKASKLYKKIIVNDFLYSNNVIYNAFFTDEIWDANKLNLLAEKWNNCNDNLKPNYFSINYGNKFFNIDDAKKIGQIREEISKLDSINSRERNILLASLIYSADKIANTVGHYDAYFRNKILIKRFKFKLINPLTTNNISIYREDTNKLVKKIKADIVYIDPPYNSRQYSRFYHLLENLVKWEKPNLEGVALKPPPENMSEYCRSKAPQVFRELINNLNCKYIVISYNNTYNSKSSSSKNKITLDEILEILSKKGITKVYEHSYKYFNSGKTNFKDHKEFLFITEVST